MERDSSSRSQQEKKANGDPISLRSCIQFNFQPRNNWTHSRSTAHTKNGDLKTSEIEVANQQHSQRRRIWSAKESATTDPAAAAARGAGEALAPCGAAAAADANPAGGSAAGVGASAARSVAEGWR